MEITDFNSLLDAGHFEDDNAPNSPSGDELSQLLSPMTGQEFANSYFAKKSFNVGGTSNKFEHIFSWEKLSHALARGEEIQDPRFNLMASFAGGEKDGSRKPMFQVYIKQVGELLNAGATICITNIHMADPALARWAQAIRSQLNFTGTVGVNCYISPDGAGLPMHYDKRIATTLQIAGKKRWIYSTTPAQAWPDNNAVFKDGRVEPANIDTGTPPDGLEFEEVELNPGDLLCLPAGAWHAAKGIGFSLALNLYFAPRNFSDQLAPLFLEHLSHDENWRGGPPVTLDNITGETPENIKSYLHDRLDEFHKKAQSFIDQTDTINTAWLESLTQNPYTGWQPDPDMPLRPLSPENRFRVVGKSLRFIQTADQLAVPCDNGILNFPKNATPILKKMASHSGSFSVPDVISWNTAPNAPTIPEIGAHLQTLYKNRVLEII
ncbi:JmjC domain-containing protein [Hirschia baltica]|uniref:Cupin 4 family protein n=1 Tax=Hirschia baltica (strain ATCC 49814 / DSM 5838 / IFAM 1418) TaxID=582402 RepID=C6XMP3_HIRBI|nr:cupin domain-containing protein [Hirschia baltica]ACT59957.1 Cupin 4 family protein [Hirschia baltica ATCC 49814]